jgi:AhpD family alkylhydroperoxidase
MLFQIFNVVNARSDERSAFVHLFTNGWLWTAIGGSLALQALVVYVPFLQRAFGTTPLSATDWLFAAGVASSVLWLREVSKISLGTVRGYRELSDAGSKTNVLNAKTRELIALAVAVTRQCDGCITIHTDAAVKHGASKEELVEALGVAIAVNAGAALVYSTRVLDALNAKQPGT